MTPATATTSNVIQAQVASGTIVAGLGTSPCDVVINGALSINNGGLAIRPSQMSNLTINPIQADVPDHSMLWYTSQTATWRRVNLLGNLYVSQVTPIAGACQNPCDPITQGLQINIILGVANGFVIANSVVTGNVINHDGLNRPGVEGNGGNSDIYFQQDNIGGYSGFGSDMVFDGTIGAPADDFGPGTSVALRRAWRHHQRHSGAGDPRGSRGCTTTAASSRCSARRPSSTCAVRTGAPRRARVTPCR